jgi:four helix bundle protein
MKINGAPTTDQQTPESPASPDELEAQNVPEVGTFPHEKLDVYRVALEMVALANKVVEQIPRGHRNIADHLLRAAQNTVLLLAEGANRRGSALKRQRFVESRGECGEDAAAADLLLTSNIGTPSDVKALKHRASRVSAMLTGLIARHAG